MKALQVQRLVNKLINIFGGSSPHVLSITPGGVKIQFEGRGVSFLDQEMFSLAEHLLKEVEFFLLDYYLKDALFLGRIYPEWFHIGSGPKNYLLFPEFPKASLLDTEILPGGIILEDKVIKILTGVHYSLQTDLWEDISHSWFADTNDARDTTACGEVLPPSFASEKYSYVLAPRYSHQAMEVGSASALLFWLKTENPLVLSLLEELSQRIPLLSALLKNPPFNSVLGRHIARAIKSLLYLRIAKRELQELQLLLEKGERDTISPLRQDYPKGEYEGIGLAEAPRGALLHKVFLQDGTIKSYQVILPSTWNMSPCDSKGIPGPCEQALLGIEVRDIEFPLEVYRLIRSFDPCMACAVHCTTI